MNFVMIPGAGGAAWYWHLVARELTVLGHDVVAVELPMGAPSLTDYCDAVVEAAGTRTRIVLVAQSMGGFTAAMVAPRLPVVGLAFLNAMIPVQGETPGEWWDAVGQADAMRANDIASGRDPGAGFDLETYFAHDLSDELKSEVTQHGGQDSAEFFSSPCDFTAWPDVPIQVLAGRDDRFFPLPFQRAVARDRLGLAVHDVPGGHLAALSHPQQVTDALSSLISGS
ncbi:alpha/beta fold hydrolase [Leifsonia sp. SIMBA_070]|uniref:alpha/beta fold hydrolase n=1 Tax=Leifsonia sp. SIMBA_070 TaxID=3085810 RepID=UPI00397CA8A5